MPVDLIEPLAELAVALPAAEVPQAVIDMTAAMVLDALVAGHAGISADGVHDLLTTLGRHAGGTHRIIGQPLRLAAAEAALANGALIHSLEFDPVADDWLVKPMSATLPAALAIAEDDPAITGRELLAAIAIGAELCCRIASAATGTPAIYRPGLLGALAATATVARLLRLSRPAARHAFGIAYSQGGMPWQAHEEGATVHGALPGFGARNAIVAAWLAAGGATGPAHILEGRTGYYQTFEGGQWERERALDGLGSRWQLRQVSIKPFPCGRLTHGAIAGVLRLQQEQGFTSGMVRRITIQASSYVVRRTGRRPDPAAGLTHQRLSIPFTVAQALLCGKAGLGEFGPGRAAEPAIRALMERIEVAAAPDIPPTALCPVRLRVEMTNGAVEERVITALPGSPASPLGRDQWQAKLDDCWRVSGQPQPLQALIGEVENLADAPSLSRLFAAIVPGKPESATS